MLHVHPHLGVQVSNDIAPVGGQMTSSGTAEVGIGPLLPHSASLEPVAALKPEEKQGCEFHLCHLLAITHLENLAMGPQRESNPQTLA